MPSPIRSTPTGEGHAVQRGLPAGLSLNFKANMSRSASDLIRPLQRFDSSFPREMKGIIEPSNEPLPSNSTLQTSKLLSNVSLHQQAQGVSLHPQNVQQKNTTTNDESQRLCQSATSSASTMSTTCWYPFSLNNSVLNNSVNFPPINLGGKIARMDTILESSVPSSSTQVLTNSKSREEDVVEFATRLLDSQEHIAVERNAERKAERSAGDEDWKDPTHTDGRGRWQTQHSAAYAYARLFSSEVNDPPPIHREGLLNGDVTPPRTACKIPEAEPTQRDEVVLENPRDDERNEDPELASLWKSFESIKHRLLDRSEDLKEKVSALDTAAGHALGEIPGHAEKIVDNLKYVRRPYDWNQVSNVSSNCSSETAKPDDCSGKKPKDCDGGRNPFIFTQQNCYATDENAITVGDPTIAMQQNGYAVGAQIMDAASAQTSDYTAAQDPTGIVRKQMAQPCDDASSMPLNEEPARFEAPAISPTKSNEIQLRTSKPVQTKNPVETKSRGSQSIQRKDFELFGNSDSYTKRFMQPLLKDLLKKENRIKESRMKEAKESLKDAVKTGKGAMNKTSPTTRITRKTANSALSSHSAVPNHATVTHHVTPLIPHPTQLSNSNHPEPRTTAAGVLNPQTRAEQAHRLNTANTRHIERLKQARIIEQSKEEMQEQMNGSLQEEIPIKALCKSKRGVNLNRLADLARPRTGNRNRTMDERIKDLASILQSCSQHLGLPGEDVEKATPGKRSPNGTTSSATYSHNSRIQNSAGSVLTQASGKGSSKTSPQVQYRGIQKIGSQKSIATTNGDNPAAYFFQIRDNLLMFCNVLRETISFRNNNNVDEQYPFAKLSDLIFHVEELISTSTFPFDKAGVMDVQYLNVLNLESVDLAKTLEHESLGRQSVKGFGELDNAIHKGCVHLMEFLDKLRDSGGEDANAGLGPLKSNANTNPGAPRVGSPPRARLGRNGTTASSHNVFALGSENFKNSNSNIRPSTENTTSVRKLFVPPSRTSPATTSRKISPQCTRPRSPLRRPRSPQQLSSSARNDGVVSFKKLRAYHKTLKSGAASTVSFQIPSKESSYYPSPIGLSNSMISTNVGWVSPVQTAAAATIKSLKHVISARSIRARSASPPRCRSPGRIYQTLHEPVDLKAVKTLLRETKKILSKPLKPGHSEQERRHREIIKDTHKRLNLDLSAASLDLSAVPKEIPTEDRLSKTEVGRVSATTFPKSEQLKKPRQKQQLTRNSSSSSMQNKTLTSSAALTLNVSMRDLSKSEEVNSKPVVAKRNVAQKNSIPKPVHSKSKEADSKNSNDEIPEVEGLPVFLEASKPHCAELVYGDSRKAVVQTLAGQHLHKKRYPAPKRTRTVETIKERNDDSVSSSSAMKTCNSASVDVLQLPVETKPSKTTFFQIHTPSDAGVSDLFCAKEEYWRQ